MNAVVQKQIVQNKHFEISFFVRVTLSKEKKALPGFCSQQKNSIIVISRIVL